MDVTVTNDREHKRYGARVDGQRAALADYIPTDEFVASTQTEVLDGYEGQGIASTLIGEALNDVRTQHRAVLAVCPFVSGYIGRHLPEYGRLLYRSRTGTIRD